MNKKYLNHHYPTDIITFNHSDATFISGDIFISVDTVRYNSKKFHTSYRNELFRVVVHGLLHLIGYDDKTVGDQSLMRQKENFYLNIVEKHFKVL